MTPQIKEIMIAILKSQLKIKEAGLDALEEYKFEKRAELKRVQAEIQEIENQIKELEIPPFSETPQQDKKLEDKIKTAEEWKNSVFPRGKKQWEIEDVENYAYYKHKHLQKQVSEKEACNFAEWIKTNKDFQIDAKGSTIKWTLNGEIITTEQLFNIYKNK